MRSVGAGGEVFRGPQVNGRVTPDTLFRDTLPGSTVGPFISQFLLLDVPYGAQTVSQRIRTRVLMRWERVCVP